MKYLVVAVTTVILLILTACSNNEVVYEEMNLSIYDESTEMGNHPWREEYNIETMPIFRNLLHVIPVEIAEYEGLSKHGDSIDELKAKAENIISYLGLTVERLRVEPSTGWWEAVTAIAEGAKVSVGLSGFVRIEFANLPSLPDGVMFSWEYPLDVAIAYLTEKFTPILGLAPSIYNNGEYDIAERILDYHFNTIHFTPPTGYNLERWWVEVLPSIEVVQKGKIGYFPIISPYEAIERMLDGQGSFGVDMGQTRPSAENVDIVGIRLVYFGHGMGRMLLEAFVPWYEIFIQMPGADYIQSWFVPAIETEYLAGNPAWALFPHQ